MDIAYCLSLVFEHLIYIIMKKNLIIVGLALLLMLSLIALNYMTCRVDAAREYITDLESTYPDYVDTVSGGDAYSEWYN